MNSAKVVLILGVLIFIAYTTENDRKWTYKLQKESEEKKTRTRVTK